MYQFIFAAIRRTDLTNQIQKIRINADTEREARAMLARDFVLVLIGKINPKNDRTFAAPLTLSVSAEMEVRHV
ncbi:host cell division inhibitor Icd-like protein [Aggregatibacter actinomycetemcomitans]|uniref:host cell division inhibitor Icd-like protein n=1 Tax=Aggregatibacter actinomycetemcomitans TaxID=714 RepID=UPI00197BEB45|nr:host cell division inhibitor Icd-like protein [Aggregatibacter actinomycetemcomitans]MBN6070555.1 host cell division inhibitor Icd-like protein [Aggregatibacter actinomycetemcomitans]